MVGAKSCLLRAADVLCGADQGAGASALPERIDKDVAQKLTGTNWNARCEQTGHFLYEKLCL